MNAQNKLLLLAFSGALISGCAHYPHNLPLARYDAAAGYRFANLKPGDNSDTLFVILNFSGGGTRAASLAYGAIEKLRNTPIHWEGKERRLLDEVDVISSVSGGSFTAAYYGLNRDKLFERFEQDFLYKDVQGDLTSMLWSPINWFRLASPTFGRIELAAEYYDREIFEGKTFNDLLVHGRPLVLLNATDMSLGSQFTFHQPQFDLLCSDLGPVSVARAVAASSDFPIAFTPLAIDNHAGQCNLQPEWIVEGLKDAWANPERFNRARIAKSYEDSKNRPHIHLLDGGISDNIGLRGPLTAIRSNDPDWSLLNKLNSGEIKKLVVITVDAKTIAASEFDKSASAPGFRDIVEIITTVPMQNYSFDTVELLREEFENWEKARLNYTACASILKEECPQQEIPGSPPTPVDLYRVYVGFDQIENPSERQYFQSMATTFHLPRKQVDDLRRIGQTLLDQAPDFRRLVEDLR